MPVTALRFPLLVIVTACGLVAACGAFSSADDPTPIAEAAVPEAGSTTDGTTAPGIDSGGGNCIVLIDDAFASTPVDWGLTAYGDAAMNKMTSSTMPFGAPPLNAAVSEFMAKPAANDYASVYVERDIKDEAQFRTATLTYDFGFKMVTGYAEFGCMLLYQSSAGTTNHVHSELRRNATTPPAQAPPLFGAVRSDDGFDAPYDDLNQGNETLTIDSTFHTVVTSLTRTSSSSFDFNLSVDGHAVKPLTYPVTDSFDTLAVKCGVFYAQAGTPPGMTDIAIRNVHLEVCP